MTASSVAAVDGGLGCVIGSSRSRRGQDGGVRTDLNGGDHCSHEMRRMRRAHAAELGMQRSTRRRRGCELDVARQIGEELEAVGEVRSQADLGGRSRGGGWAGTSGGDLWWPRARERQRWSGLLQRGRGRSTGGEVLGMWRRGGRWRARAARLRTRRWHLSRFEQWHGCGGHKMEG